MELVPYISVATDKRFIKKGEMIIIQSFDNRKEIFIGIAHDEGAAIKGENRIDLYHQCLKFLNTRVSLDLECFPDDIWSH